LEYIPNVNTNHDCTTATLELEKGKFAIATLESMAEDPPELKSSQRKHLQRINDSLTDQIRLLKNQIRRHRMEYDEKLSEMQKEAELKNCIIERREENLDRIKKFSEEIEHEDHNSKHSSDIEMARKNRSLKLLRLARNKKSLIWQKRYLTKLLEKQYHRQNVLDGNPISTPQASMIFDIKSNIDSGQSSNQNVSAIGMQNTNTDTAHLTVSIGNRFRVIGSTVVAVIRMQHLAKRWKEKIFDRIMSGGDPRDSCNSSATSQSVSVFSSASSRRSPVSEVSSC
jgi:hypothetical protein